MDKKLWLLVFHLRKKGRFRWLTLTNLLCKEVNGEVMMYVGTHYDTLLDYNPFRYLFRFAKNYFNIDLNCVYFLGRGEHRITYRIAFYYEFADEGFGINPCMEIPMGEVYDGVSFTIPYDIDIPSLENSDLQPNDLIDFELLTE